MADDPRRAAVLVPLRPGDHGLEVVLTRRAEGMPTHAGEIAFPGGRYDPALDDSLLATALREAHEEIGLDPSEVEILGALPPVVTMSSGFEIHPFVGRVPAGCVFVPEASEVVEVFCMPWQAHADPRLRTAHRWTAGGVARAAPAILFEGRLVWGATLRILDLLADSALVPRLV